MDRTVSDFRYFDALDYTVFGILLLLSALVGVYFAFCAKQKQNTVSEYLLGNKQIGIFPISMSLIASYTSGIVLLGLPSEMYTYGSQLLLAIISETLALIVMSVAFIPVFFKLEIMSTYEYLNKRFSPAVRTMGSVLFIVKMMLYIPIVLYGPALAFSQVSGFSLETLLPIVCIVCVFYTSLGGIKAVVWTDTLQMFLMLFGVFYVAIVGTIKAGGLQTVYDRNIETGRIEFFTMSWDPTIRHTFWNILIGRFIYHLAICTINQAMVQRCLAMPTLQKAHITNFIFAVGTAILVITSCYTGLVIFAAFYDCDPVSTGVISKADQLLPYFVMKISQNVPVLPGIFVSGIFSAALSTLSTGLNSMSGVIFEDFIRPLSKTPIPDAKASRIMKIITVFLGALTLILAFVVDKLSGVIQAAGSLGGITAGTLLGMFILGMFFPWANSTGAISGGIAGLALVSWISIGSQLAIHNKQIVFPEKPVNTAGCDNATMSQYLTKILNSTEILDTKKQSPFPLYAISYVYYAPIGLLTVLVVGLTVSWLTGLNDPLDMDKDLFSPVIHKFLKTRKHKVRIVKPETGIIAPITASQTKPLLASHQAGENGNAAIDPNCVDGESSLNCGWKQK